MSDCANCVEEAVYLLNDPGANPIEFCNYCLPAFLRDRATAGQLDFPPAVVVPTAK